MNAARVERRQRGREEKMQNEGRRCRKETMYTIPVARIHRGKIHDKPSNRKVVMSFAAASLLVIQWNYRNICVSHWSWGSILWQLYGYTKTKHQKTCYGVRLH